MPMTSSSSTTLVTFSRIEKKWKVLFTFLAERYERCSVMISSNLVFSKWDQIFKDPMTTMAAVDRLVHHAVILEFNGESVRAQEGKRQRGKLIETHLSTTKSPQVPGRSAKQNGL